MSRLPFSPVLIATLLGFAGSLALPAQTVTWTGQGYNDHVSTPGNWLGNTVPLNDGTEEFIFGPAARNYVNFNNDVNARKISLTGITHPYRLDDDSGDLTIGTDGLVYAPASPLGSVIGAYNVIVPVNQTWDIQSGRLEIEYYMEGAGQITKTGAGSLLFRENYNYNWTGGLSLDAGRVVISPYDGATQALGTGTLTFNGGTLATADFQGYGDSTVVLENAVVSNGLISLATGNELHFTAMGESGESITLTADTTLQLRGAPLHVMGGIAEDTAGKKLTIDSAGAIVLHGSSSWTGGTDVTKGILIFAGENNTPASGTILVGTDGYAGIEVSNDVSAFISKINPASTGTIGFDSDPDGMPDTFNSEATIDLSTFSNSLRLGSATSAILGSAVDYIPSGTTYRFGGGGGWLQVDFDLTTGRTVTLDSPSELPLTVRFTNASNAFTAVSATNSGAVFATNALPGSATLTVNAGAYLGTEDAAFTANATATNAYLTRFGASTPGIIGFDIDPFNIAASTREVDLTDVALGSLTGGAYLGTASALLSDGEIVGPGVRFTGTIAPNSDSVHRFAAYKGGALEVAGTLMGSAMIIGHPDSLGAFGDRTREEYSTVLITGNNAGGLSGGTTLYGGRLMVGQSESDGVIGVDHTHALGEGALTVAPVTFTLDEEDGSKTPPPMLAAYVNNLIIENPIHLNAPELNVGGENNFTLSGVIDGSGELYVGEDSNSGFTLTLSGANTFSGGVYLSNSANIHADSNTALGTGALEFGNSSNVHVYFDTTAPVIGGLRSKQYEDNATLYAQQTNTVLTINQSFDSQFSGDFRSNAPYPDDNLRIVKDGTGLLRLDQGGLYFYHGTTEATLPGSQEVSLQVNQGTVVLGNSFYMESSAPTVWVHGGTLALDGDHYLYNPVVVDNGGRLAGFGTFASSVNIGTGAILAPGLPGYGKTGLMSFNHLELDSGGIYEWEIQDPTDDGYAGRDHISISTPTTLVINATSEERFTLKVISLALNGSAGLVNGFDPSQAYSWAIFSSDTIEGFDPAKFTIDASLFANSLAFDARGNGTFSLAQSNSQIFLNFTPVPEPSTYALMALGLGCIGLTVWRKSRRAL